MDTAMVPVYLFLGFLDSGKTSFIVPLVQGKDFTEDEKTLMILTEEGEEEYNEALCKRQNVDIVVIDDEEDFTPSALLALEEKYHPTQVVIEYNGMWLIETLNAAVCSPWKVAQVVTTVDANTFEMYAKNMSQLMMQHIANAGMVIINRCTEQLADMLRSRNLRMLNRRADIYLEYTNGKSDIYDDGTSRFDLTQDTIEIADEDYGFWYAEAMDHPEFYDGKYVKFKGIIAQSNKFGKGMCAIGRFAMVCCAEDTQFIAVLLKGDVQEFKTRQWVTIKAFFKNEKNRFYRGNGPVLYLQEFEPADKPENDLVSF